MFACKRGSGIGNPAPCFPAILPDFVFHVEHGRLRRRAIFWRILVFPGRYVADLRSVGPLSDFLRTRSTHFCRNHDFYNFLL